MSQEILRSQLGVNLAAKKLSDFMYQYNNYRYAHTWDERLEKYGKMRRFKFLSAQLICAETAIELAGDSYSDRQRQYLANDALEFVENIKQLTPSKPASDLDRLASLRLLPNIPPLMTLKVFQERPNYLQLSRAFETHRANLSATYIVASEEVKPELKSTMEGVVAESFVLLSLQRYALKNHQDLSWVPLPAIGHENSTSAQGCILQPTWDVSVYTGLNPEDDLSLTYKAQIKKNRRSRFAKQYAEDITVIYASEDTALGYERSVEGRPYVSVNQLMREILPGANLFLEQRWDLRTDHLIDKLG